MLRTHGRVASCQPAAALSVSCLVAVCLSFTHSTHSFARPISPRLFRFSVSPSTLFSLLLPLPPPLSLRLPFYLFFNLSFFRDGRSNSLAPLQRRTCAHLPAKIFFRSARAIPTAMSAEIHARCSFSSCHVRAKEIFERYHKTY